MKSKRQKLVHNPFIDDEAAVEDDEDDILFDTEDDLDLEEDEDILESAGIHNRLALQMDQDQQGGLWHDMVERAKSRSRLHAFPNDEVADCMPQAGDGLWEIGCKLGCEDIAVYKVLQEAASTGVSLARSVLAHPGRPGRVYAEVDSIEGARRLATVVDELNKFALRRVPPEDLLPLLHIKEGAPLHPWAWVRVCDRRKRWAKYRGDVGVVRTRDPDDPAARVYSNKRFIHLVPRLFFPSDEDQSFFPPPQRLVPADLMMEKFGREHVGEVNDSPSEDPLTLTFKGEDYDPARGLVVVEAEEIAVIAEPGLLPSLLELRLINETGLIPRWVFEETVEAIRNKQLAIGTRVKVKNGDFKGLVGIIQDRNDQNEECAVDLPSQGVVANIFVKDLRAEFQCGDRLRVVDGLHKGLAGWVTDIDPETKYVTLVNSEETLNPVVVQLLAMDLVFHEDDFLRTTLRPQKVRSRRQKLGFRDWNSIYIGKHVVVINKSEWKGYEGIIKNTSGDGLAWVELQATLISHNRTQVFKLEQLGIRQPDWRVTRGRNLNHNPEDTTTSIPIVLKPEILRARSPTPMPASEDVDPSRSPAWDPTSRTPPTSLASLPEAESTMSDPSILQSLSPALEPGSSSEENGSEVNPTLHTSRSLWHWLQDDALKGSRIQLRRAEGSLAVVEFVKMDGDSALIRDGARQLREHLDNLRPVRPANINDCVVLLSGDDKGKLFKVKEFRSDDQCVIHRVGTKLRKGQTDPIHPIQELVRTYLFR